jgi:hypothetical protein
MRIEADCSGANVQLGVRVVVGPQAITSGQRVVDNGFGPIVLACRLKRNRALDKIQPSHARWRIIVRTRQACRNEHSYQEQLSHLEPPRYVTLCNAVCVLTVALSTINNR